MLDQLAPPGVLGVAVSGGGDSIALLTIAADWARRHGRALHAVTVDHGLRAESAAEAVAVSEYAARLGVPYRILRAGPMASGNLQAAARAARYALMAGWAREVGIPAVALGHTLDDQAETLLLRLARGAGVEGLSGMAPRRDWQGVAWLRPMLEIRRPALRDWLRARAVGWVDDPTNDDTTYARTRARHALAALAPLGITAEALADTARTLARQRLVLVRAARMLEATAVTHGQFGEARIALGPLGADERDTALRVLADALVRIGGSVHRPRFRSLAPLLDHLLGRGGDATTLAGCLVIPDRTPDHGGGRVLICREPSAMAAPTPLCDGAIWDGRWRVTVPPELTGAALRWHIGALGAAGCAHLRRLADDGTWQPGTAWLAAPRKVRLTVPAILAGSADGALPVAVPAADWVANGAPPRTRDVAVRLLSGGGDLA